MHGLWRLRGTLPGDGDQRSLGNLFGHRRKQRRRRQPLRDHFRFQLDTQDQQALQGLTRLVISPAIVVIAQASFDFVAIRQIHTANCSVSMNLAIKIAHFAIIMFKSAHCFSILRKERPCTG